MEGPLMTHGGHLAERLLHIEKRLERGYAARQFSLKLIAPAAHNAPPDVPLTPTVSTLSSTSFN
jgi:hypothetical protein